jgi:hypothetical protein
MTTSATEIRVKDDLVGYHVPDVFDKSYWSSMTYDVRHSSACENRIHFAEYFSIIKSVDLSSIDLFMLGLITDRHGHFIEELRVDHLECYRLQDNSTIVFYSPYYNKKSCPPLLPHWYIIYPLYTDGSVTICCHYYGHGKKIVYDDESMKEFMNVISVVPNGDDYHKAKEDFEQLTKGYKTS